MRNKSVVRLLLTVAAALFCFRFNFVSIAAAPPPPPICSEMCSTSGCDETCYLNLMEFENGNDITCLEYGSWDGGVCCGDGICDGGAEFGSCTGDCPTPTGGNCNECSIQDQDCGGLALCVQGNCCVNPCADQNCGAGHERTCEAVTTAVLMNSAFRSGAARIRHAPSRSFLGRNVRRIRIISDLEQLPLRTGCGAGAQCLCVGGALYRCRGRSDAQLSCDNVYRPC